MKSLSSGKAFVRQVWEDEKEVEEYRWGCYPEFAEMIAESGSWISINQKLQMYSAHIDRRENSLFPRNHAIQVLTMSEDSIENHLEIYCTIHTDREMAVVKGYIREIWQRAWDPRRGFWTPNLITCPLPNRIRDHTSFVISLNKRPCIGGKEGLRVNEKRTLKPKGSERRVAVCLKGMDFQEEIGDRLLEWIEAQLLLGVDHITIYTYSVSTKAEKVLRHFVNQGTLDWIKLSLPNGFPNDPIERSAYIWRNRQQKRRLELIPYNDCFYRFINTHDYVLIIDLDEVIIPQKHDNYSSLLYDFEKEKSKKLLSSINVRNVFKFPEKSAQYPAQYPTQYPAQYPTQYPEYLYMLRNNKRSRKTSKLGDYGKSFTNTKNVATVFNHFALHKQFKEVSPSVGLPEEVAVKLHYKEKCPIESRNECEELLNDRVIDKSFDRWMERLRERVETTRGLLNF
ncbi:unnamed protein product, partial [Mesorhabditis belari]|uniref:Glycosyltransferase family 92 protein n=1 Tax=Mesorhabditis belari TaxID=2138241 RepID=A0AAF3EAS1_9BILA